MSKFTAGIFESLAADDSDSRITNRRAISVAQKRAQDRFGAFLDAANSPSERTARLNMVRGDLTGIVASTCSEYGGDPEKIEASILRRWTATDKPLDDEEEEDIKREYYGENAQDLLEDPPSSKKKKSNLVKEAPGNQHLPGASDKRNRQYEHIKEQLLEDGKSEEEAKEEAARTVNKQRAEKGETKSKVADFDDVHDPRLDLPGDAGPGDAPDGMPSLAPVRDEPTNSFPCAHCGTQINRYRGEGDKTCPGCGTLHNSFGQRLAPKSQWGEETGETAADLYGPDPESLGYPYEAKTADSVPDDNSLYGGKDPQEPFDPRPPAVDTINVEPNWEGLRAYVKNMARTDPANAAKINEALGNEGIPEHELLESGPGVEPGGYQDVPPLDTPGMPGFRSRVARRPKMCPYHSEVTDISLATGDPVAGFNTMAQHAWGPQHCQGEYDGRCNFKREMVTQKYWDDKAEQAQQRAQERQQLVDQQPEIPDSPEGIEEVEFTDDEPSLDQELSEAPSAVGEGVEESAPMLEPMAASARQGAPIDPMGTTGPVLGPGVGVTPMQPAGPTGQGTPPPTQTPPNPAAGIQPSMMQGVSPLLDQLHQNIHGTPHPGAGQQAPPHPQGGPSVPPPHDINMFARSERVAEAPRDGGGPVKTVELPAANREGLSDEPSGPALDKTKWKPNTLYPSGNLPAVPADIEMEGTPHPTDNIDILEPLGAQRDVDFLDGTRSVTETQDLEGGSAEGQSTEKNITDSGPTRTWSENNGASPVTSRKVDPNVNQVRQVLEDRFVAPSVADSAIRDFEAKK